MIAYYSHFTVDPDTLSDDEFFKLQQRLEYALKQTGQMKVG